MHYRTYFQKVKEYCQDKRNCEVHAANSVFGDPCVGIVKYLAVEYRCISTCVGKLFYVPSVYGISV